MWVVEGLVRGIVAGCLELSESSGKTSHTVYHLFSISFSVRLSFWSVVKVFPDQLLRKGLEELGLASGSVMVSKSEE